MARTKQTSRKSHKRKSMEYESDKDIIENNSDGSDRPSKRTKPSLSSSLLKPKVDSSGEQYWELTKMRRVTISEFKGKKMVGIREYYEQGGKILPGKKGISLPMDQYSAFVELLPQIETALSKNGESVPRPQYVGVKTEEDVKEDADSDNDEEDDDSGALRKSNIEATSDEEDDDE